MMLLYPLGLSLMGYYAWVAPLFGRTHLERLRRTVPQLLGAAVLRLNRVGFSVEGLDRLRTPESGGPRVLMSNHNSRFDAYILLALYPRAFKSFWSNADHVTNEGFSLVHSFGRTFDMFFTHDKTNIRNTLREFKRAEEYLRAGGVVSFFPEGQFSADGWVRDIGSSCVGLAIRCSAPITPIVMLDTNKLCDAPHNLFEVLIVDDASADDTLKQLRAQDSGFTVTESDRNRGSYVARNLGLQRSRGELIAFTDADCVPDPEWLHDGITALAAQAGGISRPNSSSVPRQTCWLIDPRST